MFCEYCGGVINCGKRGIDSNGGRGRLNSIDSKVASVDETVLSVCSIEWSFVFLTASKSFSVVIVSECGS